MNLRYSGPERRKYRRLKASFLIIYSVDRPMEARMLTRNKLSVGLMSDLSEGGTAILTEHNIPALTSLLIKFTLINVYADTENRVRTMETVGEVRYNIPAQEKTRRLGIQFTQVQEEDRSAIANLVGTTLEREPILEKG